jgi:hypothetical protein
VRASRGVQGFALLRELGCDGAQGYYMSPPLPAEDFRTWSVAKIAPRSAEAVAWLGLQLFRRIPVAAAVDAWIALQRRGFAR